MRPNYSPAQYKINSSAYSTVGYLVRFGARSESEKGHAEITAYMELRWRLETDGDMVVVWYHTRSIGTRVESGKELDQDESSIRLGLEPC